MRKVSVTVAVLAALSLSACTFDEAMQKVDAAIGRTHAAVVKYAPIVGRNLILFGDTLVTAECSPLVPLADKGAGNLLKIVAGDSKSAARVNNVLAENEAIAGQLCPLVAALKLEIGAVPKGEPSQVIPAPPAS